MATLNPIQNRECSFQTGPTLKESKPSHFSVGIWKVREPEGTVEPNFLITEGNRAQGRMVPCTGSHSYHTAAFPPAGRVVLRIRSTCALLSTASEPRPGAPAGRGEVHSEWSGAASTDVSVYPDNREPPATKPHPGI